MGTNTYPALLESLQRLDSSSADDWLLNKISRHGAAASGALPKLNQLFAAALNGTSAKHNFAVALLRIERNHEGAANHIRDELRSTTLPRLTGPTLSLLLCDFPPETRASELVKAETESKGNWYSLAITLLRTDEPAGLALLYERLAENFNFDIGNALQLLLTHNSNDSRALGYLRSQVDNEFFPRNHFRLSIVSSHRHCLPDSPGVVELLKSIQPAPDDGALRKAIRETLRHIELNGKLKELRARDAASQR